MVLSRDEGGQVQMTLDELIVKLRKLSSEGHGAKPCVLEVCDRVGVCADIRVGADDSGVAAVVGAETVMLVWG